MKSPHPAKKPRGRRTTVAPPRPTALPGAEEAWRILEDLPVAVVVASLDENPHLLFLNKQFTKTFGYTIDDIPTEQDWARQAYPDAAYRKKVFDRWNEAVASASCVRGSVESMEFLVVTKDGRTVDVLFNAIVLGSNIQITLSDLTARREAERQLLTAQEELQRTAYEVTENIPAGTYTMILKPGDQMARFTFMSSRFLELCGLDRQAAEENPLKAFACVHPDDYKAWVRKNAERFEKKIPFAEECRVVVHGVTRWIFAESAPRDLPDGSIVWEGVLTDITRRKTAEAELASGEARLRKILDNIPIPISFSEAIAGGRILFINDTFTRTFGYTREDLPDVDAWARLAYPDEAYRNATFQAWDAAVNEAMRTGGALRPMDFRICTKDGKHRDVVISAAILDDLLLVGFVDITDRKLAELKLAGSMENLREVTHRMQLAAEAAGIGFWSRDLRTKREQWDEQMLALYGLPPGEFDGRWEPRVHPEDLERVQYETLQALESGVHGHYEYRIVQPDGTIRFLRGISTGLRDKEGKLIQEVGVNYDITPQKQAEGALAAAREKERQSELARRLKIEEKLKTSLTAAAAAHEINQPLGRILLTSKLVMQHEEKSPRRDPRVSGFVRSLAGEAQRVVDTIEKMKSLMLNTGTAKPRIDLRDLDDSAVLYAGSFARAAKARIAFDRPSCPAVIDADADQIQIALNNLLRNAIEAVAELPARRQRDIRVELRQHKNTVQLVVGDSGDGLPAGADADHLPESTKPGGTGLGLFIVRTAAENHGARLELARSELGGAELRLIFPKPAEK